MPSPKLMVQDGHEYREMNEAELAQYELDQAAHAQAKIVAQQKEQEKQAILDKLGLTSDELLTLLS